jgi:hypothetical protein
MRGAIVLWTALGALAATGAAVAASLGVSSTGLTTYSAAASIPASSCTLTAVADSYVDENSPLTDNGALTTMNVQSRNLRNQRSFVRFDVASCVPANASVVSATLGLYLATAPAASRTYNAQRASAAWTESVNWLSQPGVTGTAVGVATGTTNGVTLSWDVTSHVQLYADGTANNGWRIADSAEGANPARQGIFRTREWTTAAQQPSLSIGYYP